MWLSYTELSSSLIQRFRTYEERSINIYFIQGILTPATPAARNHLSYKLELLKWVPNDIPYTTSEGPVNDSALMTTSPHFSRKMNVKIVHYGIGTFVPNLL